MALWMGRACLVVMEERKAMWKEVEDRGAEMLVRVVRTGRGEGRCAGAVGVGCVEFDGGDGCEGIEWGEGVFRCRHGPVEICLKYLW
jgi:hypothetical protein